MPGWLRSEQVAGLRRNQWLASSESAGRQHQQGGRRMTPEQQALVRSSFARVAAIAPQLASWFYHRMFEIDPDVKSLFKGDTEEQGRKLMAALTVLVDAIDRLDTIVPAVEAAWTEAYTILATTMKDVAA